MGNKQAGGRHGVEPADARCGFISPPPGDHDEAAADRELADAERAVVMGTASDDQSTRVGALGAERFHAERRRLWMLGS